jgi:ferredoxin-NADP reductase
VYCNNPDESLLLVGTGTGLAPLLGIVRAALDQNHRAPIVLLHGATSPENLYLHPELTQLQKLHPQFRYRSSVWAPHQAGAADGSLESTLSDAVSDPVHIDITQLARQTVPRLMGHRVYLCGHPDLVQKLKKQCFLAGASMSMIHSDPFVTSSSTV